MPFEYPLRLDALISELAERGVNQYRLLFSLALAARRNEDNTPLYVIVGSPMRGVSGSDQRAQHLAAWRVAPSFANGLRMILLQFVDDEALRKIGQDVENIMLEWAQTAIVDWALVREAREEVSIRRDIETPSSYFSGKSVSVWGCGALGGHVAEFLARAGVRKLILRDSGTVAPGLLVRQPYNDDDIGHAKSTSLADRLRKINPAIEVETYSRNLLVEPLGTNDWTDGVEGRTHIGS